MSLSPQAEALLNQLAANGGHMAVEEDTQAWQIPGMNELQRQKLAKMTPGAGTSVNDYIVLTRRGRDRAGLPPSFLQKWTQALSAWIFGR